MSRVISYRKFNAFIERAVCKKGDVVVARYGALNYIMRETRENKKYALYKIVSRNIARYDSILLITAGIHGDEARGSLTLMRYAHKIFDYAHNRGVKLIVYPLINPSGFENETRYNMENDKGLSGNNDFIWYELKNGNLVDDLGSRDKFKKWHWSSDKKIAVPLPKETRAMHREMKQLFRERVDKIYPRVIGALDLHQDNDIDEIGAYQYAFGDTTIYQPILKKIDTLAPILKNKKIDDGFTCFLKKNSDGKKQCAESKIWDLKTNANGFVIDHDGSITDALHRLGVPYALTLEITHRTPQRTAEKIYLAWIYGIIDLIGLTGLDAIQGKSEERNKPYHTHTVLSTTAFDAEVRQTRKSYLIVKYKNRPDIPS
ncbi:MAG: succinylglutamate desuccinylase/aspartoacylase family protein [Parcubacteria group bacterium]|nr:succinylglutamate desuccinylase/aspartoacylase family protein [Parcubacteria group bacterium]